MASNIKDGSNYLDGVPVKISSKFLPPNPVTIPLALDTKYSSDVLTEQYDFSLERKVIEHNKRRRLELEAAKTKSPPKPSNADPDLQPPKEASRKAVQCPWSSNTILQPSPQQPLGKTPSCANAKSNDTKINLSDFENDTSSPFDYMELQTINDLEELNSVFQGINGKNEQQEQAGDASSSEEMSVAKSVSFPLPQNPWPEKIPNSLSENFASDLGKAGQELASSLPNEALGLSAKGHTQFDRFEAGASHSNNGPPQFESRSNNGPPQFESRSNNGSSQFESHLNNGPSQLGRFEAGASHSNSGSSQFDRFEAGASHSNNEPLQFDRFESHSNKEHSQFDRFVSKGHPHYPSSLGPCDTVGYSTLSQVPYITSNAGAPVVKEQGSLRGSKSYSDISSLSDVEIMNSTKGRSRTPPSYCSVTKPVAQESLSLQEDHFKDESSNGGLCSSSAYEELDEPARRFVDSLTEMGFPQGQVSRAVKHLGADEKKVVEHLCQIQALEESGYDSSEAEAALHLHDYNREQAKEFLDLVNQFQDLGFEKDAIKKALVQNKNDWNKTIDALLP